MCTLRLLWFTAIVRISVAFLKESKYLDICTIHNSRKLYVEYGTSGELMADRNSELEHYEHHHWTTSQGKCSVELITCPSCVIQIKFKYLNLSRSCGKSIVYDDCQCDYVLLYQAPFKEASKEKFCGHFITDNISDVSYTSKTRTTTVDFMYTRNYGRAFTLQFFAIRNQEVFDGIPNPNVNNASQIITSPFFPHLYPADMTAEYVVNCVSEEPCRINLRFTDFLIAYSSIMEFFDSNGQRLYVISGNIFRPPIITTSGKTLLMRFYANGASNVGFKLSYSFSSESSSGDGMVKTVYTDCGGEVNNLGGGITMMNMVREGSVSYDCIWIVKTPPHFLHRKTHLYVKVVNFTDFAGSTELIIRNGVTSSDPIMEQLEYPDVAKINIQKEHIVPINQGFYISLLGSFKPLSQMTIVYAAFNYQECFSELDFLCNNMRCISTLLNCDGFDHCGDNSDESSDCSYDPRDHRKYSKVPNFLFPKVEPYTDLTMVTVVFLLCTFGLIGIIFALALLLYRVNLRARHQRRIQEHINTIHAILDLSGTGEGTSEVEEDMIIADNPPDYEPPPEYSDVFNYIRRMACGSKDKAEKSTRNVIKNKNAHSTKASASVNSVASSRCGSCQSSPVKVPDSPPPDYKIILSEAAGLNDIDKACCSRTKMPRPRFYEEITFTNNVSSDINALLRNFNQYKSTLLRHQSWSDEHLSGSFSDSELTYDITKGSTSLTAKRRSLSISDLQTNLQ